MHKLLLVLLYFVAVGFDRLPADLPVCLPALSSVSVFNQKLISLRKFLDFLLPRLRTVRGCLIASFRFFLVL